MAKRAAGGYTRRVERPAAKAVLAAALAAGAAFAAHRWRAARTPEALAVAARPALLERLSRVVAADGTVALPYSEWLAGVLGDPELWGPAVRELQKVSVFKPSGAFTKEERDEVMRFFVTRFGYADARRLGLLLFRAGGPHPSLILMAEGLAGEEQLRWFFDAFETARLLDDEAGKDSYESRRVRPWASPAHPLRLERLLWNSAAVVGIFHGGDAWGWVVRAGGPWVWEQGCLLGEWRARGRRLYGPAVPVNVDLEVLRVELATAKFARRSGKASRPGEDELPPERGSDALLEPRFFRGAELQQSPLGAGVHEPVSFPRPGVPVILAGICGGLNFRETLDPAKPSPATRRRLE